MGQAPKFLIQKRKLEKREAKAARRRKVATRDKIVRFLIVCEGERNEPNYFKELVKDKYSEVRSVDIVGAGRSTCSLIRETSPNFKTKSASSPPIANSDIKRMMPASMPCSAK